MSKGYFITLEGGEGCGKSTQLEPVSEALRRILGREVISTRSPGGTPVAEKIRSILKERVPSEDLTPETELFLFAACHSQMSSNLVRGALERGACVVSDRFTDSTKVYQGYARGIPLETVDFLDRLACGSLKPDLTVVLDISPEEGLARAGSRSSDAVNDRFDSETLSFHRAVRSGFLSLAAAEPSRFRVIDASGSPDDVTKRILEAVRDGLGIL